MNDYNQLKMLKYQKVVPEDHKENNIDIDKFLEDEKISNTKSTWNKLNKIDKINKLYIYAEKYVKENELSQNELNDLKKYLKSSLDRKKLQNLKEVSYDKENGVITKLLNLNYNNNTKKFTLRNTDKKTSTIKNLQKKPIVTKVTSKTRKKSRDRTTKEKVKNKTKTHNKSKENKAKNKDKEHNK